MNNVAMAIGLSNGVDWFLRESTQAGWKHQVIHCRTGRRTKIIMKRNSPGVEPDAQLPRLPDRERVLRDVDAEGGLRPHRELQRQLAGVGHL